MKFSGILASGAAALASSLRKFVLAKPIGAVSRDAAWGEINIMRRLMLPRPSNREGRCLFD